MPKLFKKNKNQNVEINKQENELPDVKIGDTLLDLYSGTDVTVYALSQVFPFKICVVNYKGEMAWIHTSMLRRKQTC